MHVLHDLPPATRAQPHLTDAIFECVILAGPSLHRTKNSERHQQSLQQSNRAASGLLMPPKKVTSEQSRIVVDSVTVPYSIDLKTKLVTVGTGVVSNSERDTFRQKASPSLEDQIKARPKWIAILAAAKAASVGVDEQQPTLPPPPPPQSRELGSLLKAMPPPRPRPRPS